MTRSLVALAFALLPLLGVFALAGEAGPPAAPLLPRSAPLVLGLALVAAFLAGALAYRAAYRPLPLVCPALAAAAALVLSGLVGFEIAASIGIGVAVAGFTALYGALVVGYRRFAPIVYPALFVSGILACLVALVMLATRRPAAAFALAHGRAVGTFLNPNELAAYTLMLIASGAGVAATSTGRLRALAGAAAATGVLTLAATGSRSALLGLVVGGIFAAVALGVRTRWTLVFATLLAVVAAAGFVLDHRHSPTDDFSRVAAWRAGTAVAERFPLWGVGFSGYWRVYPELRPPDGPRAPAPVAYDPHNFYLAILDAAGVLGLGAALWANLAFVRGVRARLPGASRSGRRLCLGLCAGQVALAVDLVFNSVTISVPLWLLFWALAHGAAEPGALLET